jgi:hypothetical protein
MRGLWHTVPWLLILGGCVSHTPDVWTKPGVTDVDRERDRRECLAEAIDPTSGFLGPQGHYIHLDRGLYEACMARRGYTLSNERQ